MNTPKTTIGSRLLSERKRLGLTQFKLASKLGVGRAVIIRYENNGSILSIKTIEGLVALGFNMEYVLSGEPQNEPATTQPLMAIGQAIDSNALTTAQQIRLTLLTKTTVGEELTRNFVYHSSMDSPEFLQKLYDSFAKVQELAQWIQEGQRPPSLALALGTAKTTQTNIDESCRQHVFSQTEKPT